MTVSKVGETLFSVGGTLFILGLLMLKFPSILSLLKDIPGNINIGGKFYFPVSAIIIITAAFSVISLVLGVIARKIG